MVEDKERLQLYTKRSNTLYMPRNFAHEKRGQFMLEYIIIISIALSIIAFFLVYIFVYYSSYYNTSVSSKASIMATTLTSEANYVVDEGLGSKVSFLLNVPQLTVLGSFFCGNYVKISSGMSSYVQSAKSNLVGVLPTTPGNYVMYTTYNNTGRVQIGFQANITYINYSYLLNGNTLNYNLEFFGEDYTPTASTSYNVSVFTYGGQYINSTVGSATNGKAASSLYLSQVPSVLLIDVFVLGTNIVAPSCFQT